ncbi:lipoate--protein ligase [Candidatus Phytoplasma meliae]|uniref:lipoate--protein ligase n=1 Tax=Candidatus Phytoplasma meliae TaxID=1848402 RepID=A0ABS5CY02_9MOLU|nr:lipoate--protein ligase [Candidatus Phytoplasma meliae]MBP5835863.1 lipoate--protein ligase [Candidatus Phytoplasma meliae]
MTLIQMNHVCDLKPYFYYALEQYALDYLLKKNKEESYFFIWKIKGVVVGKNQIIENEVNLEYLKNNNIALFRRPTGGGCVYNDLQTPLFSMIVPRSDNFNFKPYLLKIVTLLKQLGLNVSFSGRNDILLEGKKISGNAFRQTKNGMVTHGTLLYNCDFNTMVNVITPNDQKLISKGIKSVRSRVVNIKNYLPSGMTQGDLMQYLIQGLTAKIYYLSQKEEELLAKEALRYSSSEFIFQVQPHHTKILKKRFSWGNLEIFLDLRFGKIEDIYLIGDFFHKEDNLALFCQTFKGTPYQTKSLKEVLLKQDIKDYIFNATNEDFLMLLQEGILEEQLSY